MFALDLPLMFVPFKNVDAELLFSRPSLVLMASTKRTGMPKLTHARAHVRTHPVSEIESGKIKTKRKLILDSDPAFLSELAVVKPLPHGTHNSPHSALHIVGQQDVARLHELCQEIYDMCNYRHQSSDAFVRCFKNHVGYGQSVKK